MVCCMFKEINGLLIVSNRQIIEFKNKFTILFVIVQVIIDMQISEEYNIANPIDTTYVCFQKPFNSFILIYILMITIIIATSTTLPTYEQNKQKSI